MTPISAPKSRIPTLLLACVALGAVAGCDIRREDWSRVPTPRAPRVEQALYAHTVAFAPDAAVLAPERRTELDRFLARTRVGADDHLRVVPGAGDSATMARRAASVAAYLRHLGASARVDAAGFGVAPPAAGNVDVVVRRSVVVLPGCPDWSGVPGDSRDNAVSSNWGCATAVNFGLMLAEPQDLAAGRPLSPADGDAAVLAIQRYRAGEVTPLAPEDVGTIEAQQRQDSGGGK